jgi:protein involved in polysaccharide export with SLBB domain
MDSHRTASHPRRNAPGDELLSFLLKPQMSATALLLGAVLGLGCGGPQQTAGQAPDSQEAAIVDLTEPSRPIPIERFTMPDASSIGPGDFVEIRVFGYPELSGTFLVSQDGRLNLSLVGGVMAAGKTGDELDRDLTSAYSTYYRDVDVAVNVNARSERFVYVLGELNRPGRFDFRPGERVIHSLAEAGGMTGKAREDGIILLRREPDGKDHVYRLDFSHLFAAIAPKDIYLQPGDLVFVPKSRYKTAYDFAFDFVDILSRSATTALIFDELSRRTQSLTIAR